MLPEYVDADQQWLEDLRYVFSYGMKSQPRGMAVYECLGYQSRVSMSNPIIRNPLRELGYKFMAAEAAWILGGQNDVKSIKPYSKKIENFSDDGETFFGAYGPKIVEQLPYVLDNLSKDPDSRQAVINIWRESPGKSRDIPCTLSLQFLIRNKVLHCVASMRSSDLWLGHPYDTFNFSAMSFKVLLDLRDTLDFELELGTLFLTAGSKHIYERDAEAATKVLTGSDPDKKYSRIPIFVEDQYQDSVDFVEHLWECAMSDDGALNLLR